MQLQRWPHRGVVLVGVEHDDGDGQDVDGVRAAEDARLLRVELARPGLQDADDLLRLPRAA